jgi:hypothetical protein
LPEQLLDRNSVLSDVFVNAGIVVRAGSARGYVMEDLGVLDSVLLTQFPIARQAELTDEVSVRREIVVAQQRQALIALSQLCAQP